VVETHPTTKEILLTTENAHAKPVKKAVKAVAVTVLPAEAHHPLPHHQDKDEDGMAILRVMLKRAVTATTTTKPLLHKNCKPGGLQLAASPVFFMP
jgi:uncharacterized protein YukJ